MNEEMINFHFAIIAANIDDLDLLNGFLKYYVAKGLTIDDFTNTLEKVFDFDCSDSLDVYIRLLKILEARCYIFEEGS